MTTTTTLAAAGHDSARISRLKVDVDTCFVVACALVFTFIVAGPGIPTLRHDWEWIVDREGFIDTVMRSLGGWVPQGIGAPRPYPSDYLIALANIAVAMLLGPRTAFVLSVAAVGFACAYAGSRLARTIATARGVGAAAALLTTFNPWVYTKLVAGHLFMILAYSATMFLVAESLGRRRPYLLSLFVILTVQQVQFFVVALAFVCIAALRGGSVLPVFSGVVAGSPILAGIALNEHTLLQIPYNLTWQQSQSLPPVDALALGGYFTGYSDALGAFASSVPMWSVLALAVVGFVASSRRRLASALLLTALAAWLFASGVRGPLGSAYSTLVVMLPQSALYRELYDVLAYLALAYVGLCALAAARWKVLVLPWLACGLALLAGWIVHSPWNFWVNALTLPVVSIRAPENSRFVLLPPFQPIAYGGHGLGRDPDAYDRPSGVTPLNPPVEAYPINAAMADYVLHGNTALLAALSTSRAIARPDYHSSVAMLRDQIARTPAGIPDLDTPRPSTSIRFLPEMSTVALAPVTDALDTLGAGRVFFGDAARASGNVPDSWRRYRPVVDVPIDRAHLQPSDGWVDARQAFLGDPRLAQALGGAITTSSAALLPLRSDLEALVFVDGRLTDQDAKTVIAARGGYRWIRLPPSLHAARCFGVCVVAAQGTPPLGPTDRAALPSTAVPFHAWTPWWVTLTTPARPHALMLRYNVAYDDHWSALAGWDRLAHVRVDTVVNGWIVPAASAAHAIVLLETSAAVQAICEVAGFGWACWIVVASIRWRRT